MRTTRTTPTWAVELTTQVCKDYKRALPSVLQWYDRSGQERLKYTINDDGTRSLKLGQRELTSGTTWHSGKIHISAGTSEQDQKLVVLHELAHHLVNKSKKGRREGHSIRFWRLAFELYHRYGVDLDYAYGREKDYKVKASQAYQELVESLQAA